MAKVKVGEIKEHVIIYRDSKSGLAWIADGSTGIAHSCHPNIDASGSVKGMKNLGYWGKDDKTVRANGFIYNISRYVPDDEYDAILKDICNCEGCVARRNGNG